MLSIIKSRCLVQSGFAESLVRVAENPGNVHVRPGAPFEKTVRSVARNPRLGTTIRRPDSQTRKQFRGAQKVLRQIGARHSRTPTVLEKVSLKGKLKVT